ncbi:iron uptake transporter deferrochelatase/peroxidase subunit [Phycicoccus sp. DTK01]|uniref:iron uptake transporter deferrochelatase/peroxidase subunit n=1 Tax=Phycicoccus sp. DTK01 TaxID=2785745 RepID=UPI001A8FFA12|nr:iron uptake transporter deferrochelatase/peroxidase subunit [Phycicoccus sp. DTK01]GIL37567.1 iron-dependent peroxidase [Phycicoccus sp. DTK01]
MSIDGSTRRSVLAAGAGAALAGAAAGVEWASRPSPAGDAAQTSLEALAGVVPFRGEHQAGITTPAQDRLHFVALDVVTDDPAELRELLTAWTRAAERMTAGAEAAPGGVVGGGPYGVPQDTGEALDLAPANLTVTIGYGPSLFDDRFGLADRRPEALRELPPFAGDDLDPARCGGDLCLQACADDPQVAVHAVRNLVRMGFGVVAVRWSQLGFGRTSSTSTTQVTPRNLFGFKDGTANIKAEAPSDLEEHVWVAPAQAQGGAAWLTGGSYLVARRIRMHIEVWDRSTLQDQQDTIGRDKKLGAPLGGRKELDEPDFTAKAADGQQLIPVDSHVALAHPSHLGGVRILRRGYNFTDGSDGLGHLDAGLFFIAFMRDPLRQFVPMQHALARADRLNEYIEHTGSALFACPHGLEDGQDWGAQLFAPSSPWTGAEA